jgi:hypothetical protein
VRPPDIVTLHPKAIEYYLSAIVNLNPDSAVSDPVEVAAIR